MALARVLVVEDDDAIRRGLVDVLHSAGYEASSARTGREGLELALGGQFDMVLLDLVLPELDGLAVLSALRQSRPALPVICLTARGEEGDRVRGLRAGADDYVVKPFGVHEVLARIEAVLRRTPARPMHVSDLELPGARVCFETRQVQFEDGRRGALAEREAEILAYLAANRGRPVSRAELLQRIWGVDPRGIRTRTVDMAVARLREQIGDDGVKQAVIRTVRGRGYMLVVGEGGSGG